MTIFHHYFHVYICLLLFFSPVTLTCTYNPFLVKKIVVTVVENRCNYSPQKWERAGDIYKLKLRIMKNSNFTFFHLYPHSILLSKNGRTAYRNTGECGTGKGKLV